MSIGSDDLDKPEYFLGFIADVYVDTHDNVFILDARNYLAREYSSDGKFIRSFGKGKGQGPGEFQFVCDVCADAAGHVYISDLYARRIVAFGRPDEPSRSFSTIDSGPIFDMDVDRDSKLYVGVHPKYIAARSWKGGIYQIYRTQDGALIGSIGKGWVGEAAQYHIGSNSICINKGNGEIVLSYAWPYKIEVYSPNGDLLRRFARKAPFFDVQKKDSLGNLNYCGSSQQVAWLPDGNIINMTREWTGQGESRADMKNHLDLFDEKGTYLLTAASSDIFEPEDSFNVGELAADSQGNIWIVNNDPFPHIVKYKIEIVDLKK